MLRLTESPKHIFEPYIGSEITSLFKSFNKQKERLCLYENEKGAALLRFDRRLLISGKTDFDEVISLCNMFKIKRIEALERDIWKDKLSPSFYSIMELSSKAKNSNNPQAAHDMKIPFEILKASDREFMKNTDYNYWLSDIRSMERTKSCSVFLKDDKSTASICARDFGKSLISQVATIPKYRGMGLASSLLKEICSFEVENGFTPFLISKNKRTDIFYENLGFAKKDIKALIYL